MEEDLSSLSSESTNTENNNYQQPHIRGKLLLSTQKTLAPRTAAVIGNPSSSSFTVIASPPPPPHSSLTSDTNNLEQQQQQEEELSTSITSLSDPNVSRDDQQPANGRMFRQKMVAPRSSAVAIISNSIPSPPHSINENEIAPPIIVVTSSEPPVDEVQLNPNQENMKLIALDRIHGQQIELFEWEESTLRDSLEQSISTTVVRLLATGSLDTCTSYATAELIQQHKLISLFSFEEFKRKVLIEDLEQQEFRDFIYLSCGIEQVQLDEECVRRRCFDEEILGGLHPSTVLEFHHQYLTACYESELKIFCSSRDVKLAEQEFIEICNKETVSREAMMRDENFKWIIDLGLSSWREFVARKKIIAEEDTIREMEWICPVCAVMRPAKNSMLAEINSSMPIRGADMLQLHLLHHAADVSRRQTIRSATLREEFSARSRMEFAAFGGLLTMHFECRRGVVQLGEEAARKRHIEDPAVWKASIRAAVDATKQRQVDERWKIELAEVLLRVESIEEEYTRGLSQDILFGMEVLDFFTEFSSSNKNNAAYDDGDGDDFTDFSASGLFSSADAAEVHSSKTGNAKGFAIVCRNNIESVRTLFEERLLNQQPQREDERLMDVAMHDLLPALPVEASHVRRKMGADEAVADSDRFLFIKGGVGAGAGSSASSPTKSSKEKKGKKSSRNNNESSTTDLFGPSVDALFSHFADETEKRRRARANGVDNDDDEAGTGKNAYNLASFGNGGEYSDDEEEEEEDFVFDDDDDNFDQHQQFNEDEFFENLLSKNKKRNRMRIQNSQGEDDDDVSVDSDELFELELAMDELHRKEIGARRVVIDLEWHKRIMLEKRLLAMPVAKLSIPKYERDLIAIQKIEPFHRTQLMRDTMSERERIYILFHNERRRLERSLRQQLNTAAMHNRPPFRGGGVSIVPTPPPSSNEFSNNARPNSARRKSNLTSNNNNNQLPPAAGAASATTSQNQQQQQYLGFPTDRMMASLLRFEAQLLNLFESVSARRRNLAYDYMRIEGERQDIKDEAMRQAGDAPSWTTMPFTFQPRHPRNHHQQPQNSSMNNTDNENANFHRGRRRSLPTTPTGNHGLFHHQELRNDSLSNSNSASIPNFSRPVSARR